MPSAWGSTRAYGTGIGRGHGSNVRIGTVPIGHNRRGGGSAFIAWHALL